jgi:addiction module RelE/StbE family toxin
MNVIIREAAYADLDRIYVSIAKDRPASAPRVLTRILNSIERLSMFPRMGRAGVVAGTREWVVRGLSYIIVYRIDERADELTVIAVFHGAQNRSTEGR